tara:strand:- start:1217 stop:2866 length:1650 start_codon:yes stop_codon:yes gene_type:complete
MKFLNNIEVGATPNFTLPLADGSANQILETNGSGTVTWVDKPAGSTDTNDYVTGAAFNTSTGVITLTVQNQTAVTVDIDGRYLTAETHTSQGYLKDTGTSLLNVLANYNTTDTVGWASESNTLNDSNFRLMSDGSQLSLANDQWADRNTGGVAPKYFVHMQADGAGSPRSSILNDADEFFSAKIAQENLYMAIRNANNTAGQEAGIIFRNDNDDSTIRIKGIAGGDSVTNETFRIESVRAAASRHRLQITNYGDNHMRISQTSADQPIMFYWGNGTAMGNSTNTFTTLGARFNSASLAIGGTNVPSEPSFRFLDDGDTGMYLASTGVTAFSSGGTKTLSIPTATGTNGQVLTTDGAGVGSWTTVSGGGTTYTAGSGLDLTSTEFSVEPDLRDGITHIGLDTTDFISFTNNSQIDFTVNGTNRMRLEQDGDLHVDGDVIAFSTTVSDARLKEDVETIQSASKKVSELRGVEYTWKQGSRKGQREIGLIAQEVEEVIPSIVREKKLSIGEEESYKTVDYEKLVALLIESNKEQQEIISQLEERVIDLENRV